MYKIRFLVKRLTAFLGIVIILLYPLTIKAGNTGKIAGKVVDAVTGEPLIGANILIEETVYGAATDVEGDYFILNIFPGVYNVKISMMGYEIVRQVGVQVNINITTTLNFFLKSEVVPGREIEVIAERPVIQPSVANSQTILDGDQIAGMPVAQFKDVLDKTAGVRLEDARGLFFRGEREYGVRMLIDGLGTRDNVDNQIETRVNPDAVQEASVLTGGFSPEYGDAVGGVVSVVMKEGGKKYEATIDGMASIPAQKHFGPPLKYYWDQKIDNDSTWNALAANHEILQGMYEQFRDKPHLLRELYNWRMRDTEYGDKPDMNIRGTFGGPVPFLKNTRFFLSGRYEKSYYLFNQASPFYNNIGFDAKITSNITPNLKFSFTGRYMELMGINRYDRRNASMSQGIDNLQNPEQTRENRYVIEGVEDIAWLCSAEQARLTPWPYLNKMSISNRYKNQYGIKLSHMLSKNTYYEVSLITSNYRIYGNPPSPRDTTVVKTLVANGDTALLSGKYALAPEGYYFSKFNDDPFVDILGSGNFLGTTHGNYEESRDKSILFKTMITSQINKTHQINAGFEFNYVDLNKFERRESDDSIDKWQWWQWHVYPKTLGLWLQDKMEFEGMVANLGLRADVRIPHKRWMNMFGEDNLYDYHWSSNFREGYMGSDSMSTGPFYRPPVKWVLSPRLSISHPIGTAAKIFFNYAHQNQNPPYEHQYRIEKRNSDTFDVFGNPELPYIKTIQYEVGYEQNIADLFFVAISGFYRDVSNKLANVQYTGLSGELPAEEILEGEEQLVVPDEKAEPINYQIQYHSYLPDFYSNGRGIEVRLEKRVGRLWTGWFNYDYEIFSSGNKGYTTYFEQITRDPTPRSYTGTKLLPMPRFNVGVEFHTISKFGPSLGGIYPLSDMNLSLLYWWRSQPAFTYNPDRLRAPYDPRNNMRWKPHHAFNLTFRKRFNIGGPVIPEFYIQIYNLFNTKNMFRGAFTSTEGSNQPSTQRDEYVTLLEEYNEEYGTNYKPGDREDLARQVIGNNLEVEGPGFTQYDLFLNPRQIFLGLRLEFK
jgi:hypothetical protein